MLQVMAADDKLRSLTALRDLRPGMKNVTCVFIVIDKGKRLLERLALCRTSRE